MRPRSPQALQHAPAPPDALGRALGDLRISVIDRCNFRCPYCMPEEAYPEDHAFLRARERLDFGEIERIARVFVSLGVRKLRLTGGEPLLRRDLPQLVAKLAAIDGVGDFALTTNGALLPRLAQPLRDAGLKRITLSMDSADPEVFRRMSGGRGELAQAEAAIAAAERAGFAPLKINCVVMRGVNDDGVADLVARFRGTGHILRFIEYMDVGTVNGWRNDRVVAGAELVKRIDARWPLEPLPRSPASTARRWRFRDGGGEIGFINSVTDPFCGGCTRARLSADGKLYTCLFAHAGHDLRALLRAGESDDALRATVAGIWSHRGDRYSERRAELRAAGVLEHVEMYRIGG
ncbi:MAG TPA: GTP 3',8-cyclase MoaA [Rhodanobacteraceae bacterium]|jgi:cyclic pyranopterin phosphate synthase|nr:GTP 3',8-cyclase MoaA [Rhodanobacteraceae bacterium]